MLYQETSETNSTEICQWLGPTFRQTHWTFWLRTCTQFPLQIGSYSAVDCPCPSGRGALWQDNLPAQPSSRCFWITADPSRRPTPWRIPCCCKCPGNCSYVPHQKVRGQRACFSPAERAS